MRRTFIVVLAALAALLVVPAASASASSHDYGPDEVYFEETGQYLGGEFLHFWREYGGIQTFGYPLTPEMDEDGMTVQYFERHVLELHPDNPDDYRVLLRRLGVDARNDRDMRDHRAFQDSSPAGSGQFFEPTSQNLQHGFLNYWENNGALRIFGYPISAEFEYEGLNVQFLERAIIEWHSDNPPEWRILFERLGAEAADRDGVDTSPQEHDGDTPHYHADLWTPPPPPGPTPPAGAPTERAKWMEVDLTNQMFRAWEGQTLVYEAIAATGRPAVPTLTGQWNTYAHLRYDTMVGWTPDRGSYNLPDVPHVLYYDRGYAIHGTYWHQAFGTPQSAGCVNLMMADAAWVFDWADLGTAVYVHGYTPGA